MSIQEKTKLPLNALSTLGAIDGDIIQFNGTDWEKAQIQSGRISNCITEIPQDIKLELNNGTFTLKAGSKVYVPNGSGNFDVITTTQDYAADTSSYSGMYVLAFINGNPTGVTIITNPVSGDTAPTSPVSLQGWYDTTNNLVKRYNDGWQTQIHSFPLAICASDGTNITSIDQVFNGFGYIGTTVFALPGVKGLIPNGRNEDGSLKNIECSFSNVVTQTNTVQYSGNIALQTDNLDFALGDYYDEETNYNRLSNGIIYYRCIAGKFVKGANGVITSFTPKTAFHAVDYNDKETIVGWGMPDYSAGVSFAANTDYTVQSDGIITGELSAANYGFCYVYVNGIIATQMGAERNMRCRSSFYIQVPKGSVVRITTIDEALVPLLNFYPLKGV